MTNILHHGDCLDVIPRLVAEGVVCDAVVTDPPYHLLPTAQRFGQPNSAPVTVPEFYAKDGKSKGSSPYLRQSSGFMGQQWDGGDIAFRPETWATVATILRPGGFLVAFGGTRTYHRLACAIEDAGFVIQDTIAWLYGSGFPKRRDMLKPAFEPIVLAYKPGGKRTMQIDECRIATNDTNNHSWGNGRSSGSCWSPGRTNGSIEPEGKRHENGRWPANVCHDGSEEVTEGFPQTVSLASRRGNLADMRGDNYNRTDGKRISDTDSIRGHTDTGSAARFFKTCPFTEDDEWTPSDAIFAAACSNLQSKAAVSVLSHVVARSTQRWELIRDAYRAPNTSVSESDLKLICDSATVLIQSLESAFSRGSPPERLTLSLSRADCVATRQPTGLITLTISRCKSNGFADLVTFSIIETNTEAGDSGLGNKRLHYCAKADKQDRWGSRHPTVKPVELMKWLVALVTPPGGLVLDPFAGSGTTGVAALATGRDCILIEREEQYIADIHERLAFYKGAGTHSVQAQNRNRQSTNHGPLFAETQP